MPYTVEDGGRLNGYAVEPKVYGAEPPTNSQKRNYIIWGSLGAILVGLLVVVAASVS